MSSKTKARILVGLIALFVAAAICAPYVTSYRRTLYVEALVSRLSSPEEDTRRASEDELSALRKEDDIRRVVWCLGRKDCATVERVRAILRRIGEPAIKPLFAEAVLQFTSSWSTGDRLRDKSSWPPLRLWRRGDPPAYWTLVEAMLEMGSPAGQYLINEAELQQGARRWCALVMLSQMAQPRALRLFIETVGHPGSLMRTWAAFGIYHAKSRSIRNQQIGDFAPEGRDVWRKFEDSDELAIGPLLEVVRAAPPGRSGYEYEKAAYLALALYINEPRVLGEFRTVLAKEDWTYKSRKSAWLSALAAAGTPGKEASDTLLGLLPSLSKADRALAVNALVRGLGEEDLKGLAATLSGEQSPARESATLFFSLARSRLCVNALGEAYTNANGKGKEVITDLLKAIQANPSAEYRDINVEDPLKVRKAAQDALASIGAAAK